MKLLRSFVAASALVACIQSAHAQPIANGGIGAPVIVNTTDDVIATYLGTTASFTDLLYLTTSTGDVFLFNNQSTPVGSTVNLGSFAIGTELLFKLVVVDSGDEFFSGNPTRNYDGLGHAAVQNNYETPGTTLVSFEDLPGADNQSFNDLSFSFTGTSAGDVPEPASWAMMVGGFGLLGGAMRRRKATVNFA